MGGLPRGRGRLCRPAMSGLTKTVGYGYVGRWIHGHLGWSMPRWLTGTTGELERPEPTDWNTGERHVLCRITVEVVTDERGRELAHYPRLKP